MALAAYRNLLRSMSLAFRGDQHLLHAAKIQARSGFNNQSSLDASSKEAADAIIHAEGVAQILRHNIVQGVQKDEGSVLKLRIHEDTERGDNDTVKNPLAPGGKVKIAVM